MSKKEQLINRTVSITVGLTDLAKDFGYKIDVDPDYDVFYTGYSDKEIRKMDLRLPEDLADVNKLFPSQVGMAMESANRDAYSVAIRKEKIQGFVAALEKIDLSGGGAEYQDLDGDMVSTKAGIVSVFANEVEDKITLVILNPEHLINSIINGLGWISPDLSSTEPASDVEIKQRLHNLNDYFDVYGESKPSGDLDSRFTPDIDEEFFAAEVKYRIVEMSPDEVANEVIESVDLGLFEPKDALALASKVALIPEEDIKSEILNKMKEKSDFWSNSL